MRISKQIVGAVVALFIALAAVGVKAQDTKPSPPSPNPTPAPSPGPNISSEKLALIKELMELTSSKKTIDEVLKAQAEAMEKDLPAVIWATASAMPEVAKLPVLDRESLRMQVVTSALEASRKVHGLIMEKVDFNRIINEIAVPLYDKYLQENELRDLIAFYKSPTGQKMIEVMPQLLTESMNQVSDALVPKVTAVLTELEREETERMKKQVLEAVKAKPKPATPARRSSRRRSKP